MLERAAGVDASEIGVTLPWVRFDAKGQRGSLGGGHRFPSIDIL